MGWLDMDELVLFSHQLRHKITALVHQYFLQDPHMCEQIHQLFCDMLSIDVLEVYSLGILSGIIINSKNIAISRAALRQRSHNLHGYPTQWFRNDGYRDEARGTWHVGDFLHLPQDLQNSTTLQ